MVVVAVAAEMNYEDDIEIDETALDLMWLDQARLMRDYCKLAAEARRQMDLAEEQLEFVRATLDRNVRLAPEKYFVSAGPRGVTEDAIKSAIKVQQEYRDAERGYIDARYEHEVALGAVRAFDHRKSALERLVQLHGQGYFAGPVAPHDLAAERARRDREAQRRVRLSTKETLDAIDTMLGPMPPAPKPAMRRRS